MCHDQSQLSWHLPSVPIGDLRLQAFGNSRTIYNNNSSRFGKWTEINFDDSGKMGACTIKTFLLEQVEQSFSSFSRRAVAAAGGSSVGVAKGRVTDNNLRQVPR